jgi:sulfatase maturation enzyme AslB (radical SAM superfamily)
LLQKKAARPYDLGHGQEGRGFFLPFLTDTYYINFYGGEPLLCFDLIEKSIDFLAGKTGEYGKKPQYSLTTNGSLLTDEIIRTLDTHAFSVVFSFDGYAQDIQRKEGSFHRSVAHIQKILEHPDIRLEVNSVFTSRTAGYIADSISLIIDLGVSDINLSLSLIHPWDNASIERLKEEMARLEEVILAHYGKTGKVPVVGFRERKGDGFFYCAGGQDRMAVTSEEHVWGCDLFADYFQGKEKLPAYRDFFFGDLDSFARNHEKVYPKTASRYAQLSMENFATPDKDCLVCLALEGCSVCPMVAALSGAPIGRIPAYICAIQKIKMAARRKFQEKISEIS